MSDLIEVKVDSLRVSLTNQQRIIVLKQIHGDRYLPIWIGPYESEAITIALQEVEISRPQTHDLIKNVINLLQGKVLNAIIKDLRNDIFYGVLSIDVNGKIVELDSRPSDAIAIAIRAHVPLYVSKKVMEEASIVPEEIIPDEEIQESEDLESTETDQQPANKDRLSIFADYLSNKKSDEDDINDEQDKEKDENSENE